LPEIENMKLEFTIIERSDLLSAVKCPCKFYTNKFAIALAYQLNKSYYAVLMLKQNN
jgi:hypothetical protein